MRKVSRQTIWWALVSSGFCAGATHADDFFARNESYGVNLPQTVLPNGADEVRTADGTSCRSAVGGDGAYADFGLIGAPDTRETNGSVAVYGRFVVPLGGRTERMDCTKLYDLEIQRLKMELHLARMGANGKEPSAGDEAEVNNAFKETSKQAPSTPTILTPEAATPNPASPTLKPPAPQRSNREAIPSQRVAALRPTLADRE